MNDRAPSTSSDPRPHIWIFNGEGANFPSGVFESRKRGLDWAAQNRLTGVLSEYAIGVGRYDDALTTGGFRPSKPHHGTPSHIARFPPQYDHVHITEGKPVQ